MSTPPQPPPTKTSTPFEKFIEQFNEGYVIKLKEIGQKNEYIINVDDKPITYIRKTLKTRQFNELEQLRAKTEQAKLDSTEAMERTKLEADMYFAVAQAYLKNKDTGEPITEEQFGNTIWEEVKMICDACHFRTTLGIPS